MAVKTLGSLLYSKTEERVWISIRENDIWKFEQKEYLGPITATLAGKIAWEEIFACFGRCLERMP